MYLWMNICGQNLMVSELAYLIEVHRCGISLSRSEVVDTTEPPLIQHLEFYLKTKSDI